MVDRDEAISRLYIKGTQLPMPLHKGIKKSVSFALFRLRVTFGVTVRTIRKALL